MKFIFISVRRYEVDFRKFLIEALRAAGYEAWHVRIGRCNILTGLTTSQHFCGVVGLLGLIRQLRAIGVKDKIIYIDSTGAATPVRSLLLRILLCAGIWCFDIFDNLEYDYRRFRLLKVRTAIALLARHSHILLVLSRESLRLFPTAYHLDNAADIPHVARADRNFCDFVVLAAIDQRFDFYFVSEVARLAPMRRIVVYGYVLHDNKRIEKKFSELCARHSNVIFCGKFTFDDIPEILAPYAIGFTPYVINNSITEFINPDKYYMFLQAGLEVISTDIPQARRMARWVHIARTPAETIQIAQRIEQDNTVWKNRGLGPDYSWRKRAHDLIDIINTAKVGKKRTVERKVDASEAASHASKSAPRMGRSF